MKNKEQYYTKLHAAVPRLGGEPLHRGQAAQGPPGPESTPRGPRGPSGAAPLDPSGRRPPPREAMLKSRLGSTADKKKKEKSIVGAVRCERERERHRENYTEKKKRAPAFGPQKKTQVSMTPVVSIGRGSFARGPNDLLSREGYVSSQSSQKGWGVGRGQNTVVSLFRFAIQVGLSLSMTTYLCDDALHGRRQSGAGRVGRTGSACANPRPPPAGMAAMPPSIGDVFFS